MFRRPEQTDRLHDAVTAYPKDPSEVKDVLLWKLGASQEQAEQAIRQGRLYHIPDRSEEVDTEASTENTPALTDGGEDRE
jgi:hypothetical protein